MNLLFYIFFEFCMIIINCKVLLSVISASINSSSVEIVTKNRINSVSYKC